MGANRAQRKRNTNGSSRRSGRVNETILPLEAFFCPSGGSRTESDCRFRLSRENETSLSVDSDTASAPSYGGAA